MVSATSPASKSPVPTAAGGRLSPAQRTVLLSFLALAVFLRCLWLTKESLWFDELMSWWISVDFGRSIRAEPSNPPVYHLLLHAWFGLFGTSEMAIRSMSILPSVASLFVTWRIARLLLPVQAALLTVVYQSVSTFHILYAQEARTHALLLLLLSTCFVIVLKIVDPATRGRAGWLALYSVLAALSMYTHFVATFYLCMHALYVVIVCWRDKRTILAYAASGLAACILFAPWLAMMVQTAASGGQLRRHLFLKVPQTYLSFLFGDTLIPLDERAVQNIRGTLLDYAPVLAAACLVTVIVMFFAARALARLPLRASMAILFLGVGPVLLSLIVSLAGVPMFDERYVLSSTPFVYMAVALGLIELWRAGTSRSGMRVAALGTTAIYGSLLVLSLFNYYGNSRFGKEQWREVFAYLERETPPGIQPLIVFEPDFIRVSQDYYGRRPMPRILVNAQVKAGLLSSPAGIAELGSRSGVIWLIRSHERDDLLLEAFRKELREQSHAEFPKANGIDVYRFQSLPQAAQAR